MPTDFEDDSATAVAPKPAPKAKSTVQAVEDTPGFKAVAKELPEREFQKRKIHLLFAQGSSQFYRVNYHADERITSFWVEVSGGLAKVSPEANQIFKPDSK